MCEMNPMHREQRREIGKYVAFFYIEIDVSSKNFVYLFNINAEELQMN